MCSGKSPDDKLTATTLITDCILQRDEVRDTVYYWFKFFLSHIGQLERKPIERVAVNPNRHMAQILARDMQSAQYAIARPYARLSVRLSLHTRFRAHCWRWTGSIIRELDLLTLAV